MKASIGGLMVLIAVGCVVLAAFRVHPALGAYCLGVSTITCARIAARRRSQPTKQRKRVRHWDTFTILLTVSSSAILLLTSSGLALIIEVLLDLPIEIHSQPRFTWTAMAKIVLSSFVGIPTCWFFRRVFGWCAEGRKPGRD
jgi:hypothetical protein